MMHYSGQAGYCLPLDRKIHKIARFYVDYQLFAFPVFVDAAPDSFAYSVIFPMERTRFDKWREIWYPVGQRTGGMIVYGY